jgi:sialate O-acetylesterase
MMRLKSCVLVLTGLLAFDSSVALADVRLPALISDNMVLQQGVRAPIWGWADPGEPISVNAGTKMYRTTAGKDGRWLVRLAPMKPGQPFDMTVAGRNAITVRNVQVGEVWICSGQSNMWWPVWLTIGGGEAIDGANLPDLRMFTVPNFTSASPQSDCKGAWEVATPPGGKKHPEIKGVAYWSGVGFYFGRELHRKLGVPVGMIHVSWSGSLIEPWIDRQTLLADPEFRPLVTKFDDQLAVYAKKAGRKLEEVKAEILPASDFPWPPKPTDNPDPRHPGSPSAIYNYMVNPLVPFAFKGLIWYQGESNAPRAHQYRKLLPAMISDWRRIWGEGNFPFPIVQLANINDPKPEPGESEWAELREAQLMATRRVPKTGLVVTIDVGEANNVHPVNKEAVGHRLALAARAIAYGQTLAFSGPILDSMTVEGSRIRLRFKHIGGGLQAKGGAPLKGFAIADGDRKFVWAEAAIEGNTVVVSSPKLTRPVAVRYQAKGVSPEWPLVKVYIS